MSSARVIWLKISTRLFWALSFGRSLSSSTIFPAFSQRWGPSLKGGPGSAPSNKYGWLHTLRSCMSTLSSFTLSGPPSAFNECASLDKILVYHARCISDIPMYSLVSILGGRSFATSLFTRLSMNGRSTVCSFFTTFSRASSPPMENHSSNSSLSLNTSGNKKLSSAQSSCRLFCRGVPVINKRSWVGSLRTAFEKVAFSFLMRCASSMMRYRHANFCRAAPSRTHTS
mmetsp:Transcript_27525/g.56441  ORF Transcript_27525/g.56441 Transcript_27525/m.56441 type:complete len:228 (+) Transcript_27525:757-1440(+)